MPEDTKIVDQQYALVEVDRLSPHPDNPRQGDVGMIAESIDRHGFYGAVIAQKETGHVLAGNHRLLAARDQGIESLPVIWVDVDDATARRILLVDNRSAEIASWDYEQLATVLDQLKTVGDDLQGLGWQEHELEALLGAEWRPESGDSDLESFTNSFHQHSIKVDDEQWQIVSLVLDKIKESHDVESDGDALTILCKQWLEK